MTTELEAAAAELAAKELATADAVAIPGNGPQGVGPDNAEIPNTASASAVAPMSDIAFRLAMLSFLERNSEVSYNEIADRALQLAKRYKGEV